MGSCSALATITAAFGATTLQALSSAHASALGSVATGSDGTGDAVRFDVLPHAGSEGQRGPEVCVHQGTGMQRGAHTGMQRGAGTGMQ